MENIGKFLVCGGDLRQQKLAYALTARGWDVCLFGFDQLLEHETFLTLSENLALALEGAAYIVLGLPGANEQYVNTPLYKHKIALSELFGLIKPGQAVYGGMLNDAIQVEAKKHGVYIADYFAREELNILNAVPTVEGAIKIAMEETPYTIHGSRCLVLGYGRIGKLLASTLSNLGAHVQVAARKCADFAWIHVNGYQAAQYADLFESIGQADIIFNTVPSVMLNYTLLNRCSSDVLIIDLASKPGGIDMGAAASLGRKVVWALSLPGKFAPTTAGEIIMNTILNMIAERKAKCE